MKIVMSSEPVPEKRSGCGDSFVVSFGIVLPLLSFFLDASMRMDPVLWGDLWWGGRLGRATDVGARQAIVYALLAVSLVGVALSLVRSRTRLLNAATIACLTVATGFAAIHAIVFLPMALFMAVLMIVGIGFIGMSPYFALIAWGISLARVLREQAALASPRWVVGPVAAGVAVLVVAAAPFVYAHTCVDSMKRGDPRAISRGFRELGVLAPLVRQELVNVYTELDGPAQVRFRNLYIDEFGGDPNGDVFRGGRGAF